MKHKKHGKSKTKIYGVWNSMRNRCKISNTKYAKYYKYKGITYCDEWEFFVNFYKWAMENGYKEGLTLDRIDSNKNYCPENCRWVDRFVQNSNTSKNRYITFNGENKTLSQWAREIGICRNSLIYRINKHGIEKSLSLKGNLRGKKI